MPSWLYAEFAMCQIVPQSYTIMQKKGIKSDRMGIFSSISFINKQ